MSIFSLRNNSDRTWNWLGRNDPYYGVLTSDRYRQQNLTEEGLKDFFDSGQAHVDRVLARIEKHFGAIPRNACLDFGCGVGRLAIPFARGFQHVTAVDISDAMISEAKRNCERFNTKNVEFYSKIEDAPNCYDLVHSYIVLQHIPVARGLEIIDELINKLQPSGIAFIHLTIGRQAGFFRDAATALRKNVKPLHWLLNVLARKPLNTAYMQMNTYQLNPLLASLFQRGIRQLWIEIEKDSGPYSVCMLFRKMSPGESVYTSKGT